MKTVKLEVDERGGVAMLHDDDVAAVLGDLGAPSIRRVSHVEYNNTTASWCVYSARTGELLAGDFGTRADALAWEKNHYAPDGAGWQELIQEDMI